jgi:hypothetical protein
MKKKTAPPSGHVSMAPRDASHGGAFQGGVTTIRRCRFGLGYPKGDGTTTASDIVTLRILHTPKGQEEERTEVLSCGNSAIKNFSLSKDGRYLIPRTRGQATGIHVQTNAMMFLDSLVKAGFPDDPLATIGVTALEGLVFKAEQRPVTREGLDLVDETRPKTVLVCAPKGIVRLPAALDDGSTSAEADDEAEEEEETEEEEEAEAEEEDEGGDDEEDEAPAVSDRAVLKHLIAILGDAGDSVRLTKLGALAYGALRKQANRNALVARMVDPAFLDGAKGVIFDTKGGGSVRLA